MRKYSRRHRSLTFRARRTRTVCRKRKACCIRYRQTLRHRRMRMRARTTHRCRRWRGGLGPVPYSPISGSGNPSEAAFNYGQQQSETQNNNNQLMRGGANGGVTPSQPMPVISSPQTNESGTLTYTVPTFGDRNSQASQTSVNANQQLVNSQSTRESDNINAPPIKT